MQPRAAYIYLARRAFKLIVAQFTEKLNFSADWPMTAVVERRMDADLLRSVLFQGIQTRLCLKQKY